MGKLKTELLHHQQKMDEYNQLKNEIGAADGNFYLLLIIILGNKA